MQKNQSVPPAQGDSLRRGNAATLNAFARILATLVFLILFGVLGALLDRWLGTSFFILIGFVIGMVFAVVGMLYVVKVAELESRQAVPFSVERGQEREESTKADD